MTKISWLTIFDKIFVTEFSNEKFCELNFKTIFWWSSSRYSNSDSINSECSYTDGSNTEEEKKILTVVLVTVIIAIAVIVTVVWVSVVIVILVIVM